MVGLSLKVVVPSGSELVLVGSLSVSTRHFLFVWLCHDLDCVGQADAVANVNATGGPLRATATMTAVRAIGTTLVET